MVIDVDLDAKWEDLQLKIDLLDELSDSQTEEKLKDYSCGNFFKPISEEPIINEKLSKYISTKSNSSANSEFTIPIKIDLDWRDLFHRNHNQIPTKKYSVMVIIENKRTGKKYYCHPKKSIWKQTVNSEIKEIPSSHFFAVKYNTYDFILKEFEDKKITKFSILATLNIQKKNLTLVDIQR